MRLSQLFLATVLAFAPCVHADEEYDKRHILYLMSIKEVEKAIDLYLKYYDIEKKHDLAVLQEIGHILLDVGASGDSVEKQLLSLYGFSLSGESSSFHFLETAIKSPYPIVQAASLQLLSQKHDDLADDIIAIGLKSNFLMIRFEALSHLVTRKAKNALGYVEALSNLLHPRFRPFFVEFYALHGSVEATRTLRQMIKDSDSNVRIAAIIAADLHERDDLLVDIRTVLTHSDPILKEAAAFALGQLRDLNAVHQLKIASHSPFPETKLAALSALYQLGDKEAKTQIIQLAKEGNLFAILFLASVPESGPVLEELLFHPDPAVRVNAILSLLAHKNPKVTKSVLDLLLTDTKVTGFAPLVSQGRSLVYWRPISMSLLPTKDTKKNLEAVSLNFFEELLRNCIDLPESDFFPLAEKLLQGKQTKLIPLLIRLLETTGSDKAKRLLQVQARNSPHPLVKGYCNLALYRLGEKSENREAFFNWLSTQRETKMIEFRPMMERGAREDKNVSNYELSPEEVSGLMVESFDAIASKHDIDGLVFILKAMRDGNANNRYALAGLLLKALH